MLKTLKMRSYAWETLSPFIVRYKRRFGRAIIGYGCGGVLATFFYFNLVILGSQWG